MDRTTLGDRMKNYEKSYDFYITNRLPIIVRCDGKNFSKWTKSFNAEKPFDSDFVKAMSETAKLTSSKIEGCMFSYTQSDEITFVLRNDQSLESVPWFGNRVQKICSAVSSIVSAHFNNFWREWYLDPAQEIPIPPAYFDTRVFAVPNISEAINLLIWRQNDCTKNSISAACYYEIAKIKGKKTARKLMHKLNQKQQQELLFQETGINWNDYPKKFKRGIGCYNNKYEVEINGEKCWRSEWEIDHDIPTFTQQRNYLENILSVEGE